MRPVVLGIACERFNALGVCGRQSMGRYDNAKSRYLWMTGFFNRMCLEGDTTEWILINPMARALPCLAVLA